MWYVMPRFGPPPTPPPFPQLPYPKRWRELNQSVTGDVFKTMWDGAPSKKKGWGEISHKMRACLANVSKAIAGQRGEFTVGQKPVRV